MAKHGNSGKLKVRKYAVFTNDEQKAYEALNLRQRRYVDFRGQGYPKGQSYTMAGYATPNPNQACSSLEKNTPIIPVLINKLLTNKKARELTQQDSDLNRQIDALAKQTGAETMLKNIEGADGETARRIQFYRDIMNGKTKSLRKTVRKNAAGEVIETKIEEVNDIETRMKARKELDRILGLTAISAVDNFQIGDITVNIVDASKKDAVEDSRNKVNLELDNDVQIVDADADADAEKTGGDANE